MILPLPVMRYCGAPPLPDELWLRRNPDLVRLTITTIAAGVFLLPAAG